MARIKINHTCIHCGRSIERGFGKLWLDVEPNKKVFPQYCYPNSATMHEAKKTYGNEGQKNKS